MGGTIALDWWDGHACPDCGTVSINLPGQNSCTECGWAVRRRFFPLEEMRDALRRLGHPAFTTS